MTLKDLNFKFPLLVILFVLLLPIIAQSQNTIALPDVTNYSKKSYRAGSQNWDIDQDKEGVMYFANNEGLLVFDGNVWSLYPLPNKTIVRSVLVVADKIYVGGQDELGYFSANASGKLVYTSLTLKLATSERSITDVWDIVHFQNKIFFRTIQKVIVLENDHVSVLYAPTEWGFMGECNGKLYFQDFEVGLMQYSSNKIVQAFEGKKIFFQNPITNILPLAKDSMLICTLSDGVYKVSRNNIVKFNVAEALQGNRLYTSAAVSAQWTAFGTNENGLFIADEGGEIVQQISKNEGLQNSNILHVFVDNGRNIWLGLNNGIDFISFGSAITQIRPMQKDGAGYAALLHDGNLFFGTSDGLFKAKVGNTTGDLGFTKANFTTVRGSLGQVWSLANLNQQLLIGKHEGAFLLKGEEVKNISNKAGYWNFIPGQIGGSTATVFAGHYKGITAFQNTGDRFVELSFAPGFTESSRFVIKDDRGNLWISHPYHGVFKLSSSEKMNTAAVLYDATKGLPSLLENYVFKIKGMVVAATIAGIYVYNDIKDVFEPSPLFAEAIGNLPVRYLKEDGYGNVWFISNKRLALIDFTKSKSLVTFFSSLNEKILSGFENIYPLNYENIFVGGEQGFFHINLNKYRTTSPVPHVRIGSMFIANPRDSLLYGGFGAHNVTRAFQGRSPEILYNFKSLRFTWSSTSYADLSTISFSYRLKGFEDKWSEWTNRTEKEYTNLPAGKFVFEIKARSNIEVESSVASYGFTVLPPWYKTLWAAAIYLVFTLVALYFFYRYLKLKFYQQQRKYQEEQKRMQYIYDLEKNKAESAIITLQNEKLEADIHFKNSELASSAMHLVKKGELLTRMKTDLAQLTKDVQSSQATIAIKKMIRFLNDEDKLDEEWETFSKHFDKVHSDFNRNLKTKHPGLSGNEVKLCSNLRMNMSTKEIAQLMNISVRGVEISRYRLRKKLGIPTEVSLYDYLLSV